MAQAIEQTSGSCPLCDEQLNLNLPDWRVAAKWRDALAHRDKWATVSDEFRASGSIEEAAQRLSISADIARLLLEFLCTEVCGCRAVTCVSCLDDYRSAL
ncbi:MAG TPA: hypothetical protein VLR90_01125 [Blastocatellia bacterium]|nr:hypothetical protein [Blastocatellia bacterium]